MFVTCDRACVVTCDRDVAYNGVVTCDRDVAYNGVVTCDHVCDM